MTKALPLHFLKVINFEEIDKATNMFLHLLLENILESCESLEQIKSVFENGFLMMHTEKTETNAKQDNSKIEIFVKGMSEYILGKFYLRL